MRPVPVILLLVTGIVLGSSGCHRNLRRFGPPPPAYACDGYGCDGYDAYGGFSECVDDGQYYSRRDARRMRRDMRRGMGRHGGAPTYNGLPVVAAYIVPMEAMGCGDGMGCYDGMGCCDGMMGDCMSCGEGCMDGGWTPCESCETGGVMSGCGPDGCGYEQQQWQSGEYQPTPTEGYQESYPYDGEIISPRPVPPAQEEGPWNPPGQQESPPRTLPESGNGAALQNSTWVPARLP